MSASASQLRGRAALTAAVAVLPLVGACASLIGLEDAEVDKGSVGTGAQSSGSTGGAGGAGGGGSTSDGVATGAGGAAPVDYFLPDLDGVRIHVGEEAEDAILVLAMRRGGDVDPDRCLPEPPGGGQKQAVVNRYLLDGRCAHVARIEGEGFAATSISVPRDPLTIGIAGIYKGPLSVDGAGLELDVPEDSPGGEIAIDISADNRPFTAIPAIVAEGSADAPGRAPAFALPDAPGPPLVAGTFTSPVSNVECGGAYSGTDPLAGYVVDPGGADGCAAGNLYGYAVLDAASGQEGGPDDAAVLAVLAENELELFTGTEALEGQEPGTHSIGSLLPDLAGAGRVFSLRFVPAPSEPYFIVGGASKETQCAGGNVAASFRPFVQMFQRVSEEFTCTGLRLDEPYDAVVVGMGTEDDIVVAAHDTRDGFDLLRITRGAAPAVIETLEHFCEHCEVFDLAKSGGTGWILGRGRDGDAKLLGTTIPDGQTFLYHREYDALLVAPPED